MDFPGSRHKKLNITSKTTLQKYRDQSKLRYTELSPLAFLYDVDSINEFLEKKSHDSF